MKRSSESGFVRRSCLHIFTIVVFKCLVHRCSLGTLAISNALLLSSKALL